MTRAAAVLLICCIASPAALAQSSDPDQLSDKQRLGWRLYEQSCSICHTKPNLVLSQFGPALSRESLKFKSVSYKTPHGIGTVYGLAVDPTGNA